MDELVCGAGGKTVVILPVHVQSGRLVVGKLLLYLEGGREEARRRGEGRKERRVRREEKYEKEERKDEGWEAGKGGEGRV